MNEKIKPEILTVDDGHSIIDLLHQVYKNAYIVDWMYDYKKLSTEIISGRYIFLGIKLKDKLIAMLSISYPDSTRCVAELSTLVVHPMFRDYHHGESIRYLVQFSKLYINEEARKSSVTVLLSRPVTKHLLSQKLLFILGMTPVGLSYCTRPEERELQKLNSEESSNFHRLDLKRNDQVIAIFCYPKKIKEINICVPESYFSIIQQLLSIETLCIYNVTKLPKSQISQVETRCELKRSFIGFYFRQGCHSFKLLKEKIESFITNSFRVIHISLNVSEYDNREIIQSLHSFGFVYSHMIPCYYGEKGHALVLQYLNDCASKSHANKFLHEKIQQLHQVLQKDLICAKK